MGLVDIFATVVVGLSAIALTSAHSLEGPAVASVQSFGGAQQQQQQQQQQQPVARANANRWLDMILHLRDEKNLCLDIEGAATHDGANVQLYPCSGTGVNWHQRWDYTDDGALVSLLHGKCLDAVQVSSNGANVQVWTCTGALNQKWEYTGLGQFRSLYSGKCLRVSGKEETGANAYMWDCNPGDPLEQWDLKDGKSVNELPTIATHSGCTCKHSWAVGDAAFTFPHNCVNSVDASGKSWCFVNEPDCGTKSGQPVKLWDFCTPINTDIPYTNIANEHTQKMDQTYNALAQQAAASGNMWNADGTMQNGLSGTGSVASATGAGAGGGAGTRTFIASQGSASVSNLVVSSVASANSAPARVPHTGGNGGVGSISSVQSGFSGGGAPASIGSNGVAVAAVQQSGVSAVPAHVGVSGVASNTGGVCLHGRGQPGHCICDTGFVGATCEKCAAGHQNYPHCVRVHNKCSGCVHGTCDPSTGFCACPPNRQGSHCEYEGMACTA